MVNELSPIHTKEGLVYMELDPERFGFISQVVMPENEWRLLTESEDLMAGTKEGGVKAAATNKRKHGSDFYKRIGSQGGRLGTTGGFASEKVGDDGLTGYERASVAGVAGGTKSRRKPTAKKTNRKEK
jgi:hypothetical protein